MARDPQATIGGQTVEVVTAVPQGRPEAAPASADASRVAGIWLDGYVPRDAEILTTWRRDAGTRFPAHLWLDDGVWACEVLITGLE